MKRFLTFFAISLILINFSFSSEISTQAYVEGVKFYSSGNFDLAKIMLKKAIANEENATPESYYLLINTQINLQDKRAALNDCYYFLDAFPSSLYTPRVSFQTGKLLFELKEYDKAIFTLSDFCHQNQKDELYSLALFYIGESLFASYEYEKAEEVFQRIVDEFPSSPKFEAAKYRIESIFQRNREEKLLYLLKQTGEEYLTAKEEYEKQIRVYNTESIITAKQKLQESQAKNQELEKQVEDLQLQLAKIKTPDISTPEITIPETSISEITISEIEVKTSDESQEENLTENQMQIRSLKEKALEAQELLKFQNIFD